jgi:hypothetical protein
LKSGGLTSISKRFFYSLFKTTWENSFITSNIQGIFSKPGIWPINGIRVIAQITRPLKKDQLLFKVPLSPKTTIDIRRLRKEYNIDLSDKKLDKLFDILE